MRRVVGDLEADGFLEVATTVWCGAFRDIDTEEVFQFRPEQIKDLLKFLDSTSVLIMHNGIGYDLPLLEKLYGYTYKGKVIDTLIMSRLLFPNRITPANCLDRSVRPHSIASWGYTLGRGKPDHSDWSKFSEDMLFRCTEDTEIGAMLFDYLDKEMQKGGWDKAMPLSHKLFTYLGKQERFGWYVDQQKIKDNISLLTKWIDKLDQIIVPNLPIILEIDETKIGGVYKFVSKPFKKNGQLTEAVTKYCAATDAPSVFMSSIGGPFSRVSFRKVDMGSVSELKKYLLDEGWEPEEWNYNDDGERTSPKMSQTDPFVGIRSRVGKLVAKRLQCRHRRSQIEGIQKLIRPDGRVPAGISGLAVTGRAKHKWVVNIPKAGSFFGKQMRKMFACPSGKVLVGTDSDSCQLRMLAARMKDPNYIKAIMTGEKSKGTDNHSLTMKIADLDSRDTAKTTIYALLFGAGDLKLGQSAKKPGKGAEVRRLLYSGFPGLGALVDGLTKEWRSTARKKWNQRWGKFDYFNGYITGLDGRPIQVGSEHQLLVYLLQSDEAIMMTAAYNKFHIDMEKKGYTYGKEYGVVGWMHDEFTVECDEAIAEIVKDTSEKAIAWAGLFYKIECPHIGDGKIGKNWYDIH
jgi:DNA polymerase-1